LTTHLLRWTLVALTVALTGCAASVERQASSEAKLKLSPAATKKIVLVMQGSEAAAKSKDWEPLVGEFRGAMASATASAGMTFASQDSSAAPGAEAATQVVIRINDYRYLSAGARYGFGIMTGNAFIDADASFFELPAKSPAGTRKYNTSSSAWQGVFSAMTDKQVLGICTEIVKEVGQP
jgi:hypothetical protein